MVFKKRYILAQEAEERIVSLFRNERNDAAEIFNTAIDACQTIILDMYDNAPDVVEVVRCKDCEHLSNVRVVPKGERICLRYCCGKKEDGFCDEGERREDNA